MGIKGNLILAVAAGSMLFMTPRVVQADEVDQTQTQAVTATDNSVNDTTSNPANTEQPSSSVTQPVSTTPASADNTNNTTTADTTTTVNNQNQYSDEAADGIFHVNGSIAFLYQGDGTRVDNRALGANTPWYTDTKRTWNDGSVYYRVSTNEYVNQTSGNFKNNVEDYSGTASVTYDSDVKLYQGYGKNAVDTGSTVSQKSDWKVDKRVSNGGQYWYEVGNNVWLPQSSVVINDSTYPEADWVAGVPLISQRPELPNGCEITAVTMMLQYAGANVNKMQLAYEMPRSSDPNYGYMGQPWDSTGVTIFPSALMRLVEKYAGSAKNLSGQGLDAIKYQISIGHPVVTWHTLHGFLYHALTVTGYDSNYIYYNDCWLNQSMQMGINEFISNWNTQNRMAISY
ncbi:C39 family peptidase [Companilactobacillus kedongensis]|uniref:C39 family peptidase n=1 Tax=Companilactobacillus kedongensis TaxID=2486004 RepID=UPI000F77C6C3|nr:C39 family peptidase [Companilactobacillus kedongensis]